MYNKYYTKIQFNFKHSTQLNSIDITDYDHYRRSWWIACIDNADETYNKVIAIQINFRHHFDLRNLKNSWCGHHAHKD